MSVVRRRRPARRRARAVRGALRRHPRARPGDRDRGASAPPPALPRAAGPVSRPSVTGTGPWPGTDALEAQSVVVGDLVDTPVGGRGAAVHRAAGRARPVERPGRARGRAARRAADRARRRTAGSWRTTPAATWAGRRRTCARTSTRSRWPRTGTRARSSCRCSGPMTLAASLYLSRGDRVLSDAGAVRELAASLAAGIAEHLAALRRCRARRRPIVLLHEPLLAQVMAGVLPSFSGYSALRSVPGPVAAAPPRGRRGGRAAAGASSVVVHGGTAWSSLGAIRASGADGFALAVAALDERSWERVAEVVEGGLAFWPELPPQASSQCAGPDVAGQADLLLRPWRSVGLPAGRLRDVVLLAGDATGVGSSRRRPRRAGRARARRAARRRTSGVLMRRPLVLLLASAAAIVGLVSSRSPSSASARGRWSSRRPATRRAWRPTPPTARRARPVHRLPAAEHLHVDVDGRRRRSSSRPRSPGRPASAPSSPSAGRRSASECCWPRGCGCPTRCHQPRPAVSRPTA